MILNLLGINDLSEFQISEIFALGDKLKSHNSGNNLNGKTFILFFPESSIRTRITFEKGIKDLGGECILFPPDTLDKREKLTDVIQYIENWADGVIVRHPDSSKIQELSRYTSIPIINAMTSDNHPCEILSDLYSISKIKEDYRDLVYTFVGGAGNISRSWMNIAKVMNLKFNHVCTSGNELCKDNLNYKFHSDLDTVLMSSDVILTDSLSSDLRTNEYINKYQITLERMKSTKRQSILNPCPPFFRNEEISENAISSDYFVGYGFKKNLIYVQQAIILYCCGIKKV
ncbi:ornithine carbamoyltransferase [Virgibacillus natechei]|uniref:Ornithine carbamoyltransferase n=1 Tax=Virgibacillus natechei TaxID=1216297 RepID=A0ABS4IC60_9BACI|nr:ornithine carbamoyltransferase [Virgibacillus natechei]MBP1968523.1 ornithine carbamoyltransferase [Virgibacillus natechei]UZD13638.1 ornithine carbamoyltransferase [Virgibacillus natechei]